MVVRRVGAVGDYLIRQMMKSLPLTIFEGKHFVLDKHLAVSLRGRWITGG